jgi:hypothetical protein
MDSLLEARSKDFRISLLPAKRTEKNSRKKLSLIFQKNYTRTFFCLIMPPPSLLTGKFTAI